MVNRVLLNTQGLKISAPGYDVATAPEARLLFNSDWGTFGQILKGSAYTNGSTSRVFFGRTFSSPPQVQTILRDQNTGQWISYDYAVSSFQALSTSGLAYAYAMQPTYIDFYSASGYPATWFYTILDFS